MKRKHKPKIRIAFSAPSSPWRFLPPCACNAGRAASDSAIPATGQATALVNLRFYDGESKGPVEKGAIVIRGEDNRRRGRGRKSRNPGRRDDSRPRRRDGTARLYQRARPPRVCGSELARLGARGSDDGAGPREPRGRLARGDRVAGRAKGHTRTRPAPHRRAGTQGSKRVRYLRRRLGRRNRARRKRARRPRGQCDQAHLSRTATAADVSPR